MSTNYQKAFHGGKLSKTHFTDSEITLNFIDWLIPFIEGTRNLSEINFDYKGQYTNFSTIITGYNWKNLNFGKTVEQFTTWRKDLESSNQDELLTTCSAILKWGGILQANRLEKIADLRFFLDNINAKLSKNEIIIYDLNPNFINSGFTKIYAALNEKFIMYDGRVGAALCYFIQSYLNSDVYLNENKKEIPLELNFGWSKGMGEKNRNPNATNSSFEKFEEITERNRELHFTSNIKANWLLETIAPKVKLPEIKNDDKVFALQTALFMLGEDVPTK